LAKGLTRKIAETVDFSLIWYRGTRDEFFIADALENYFLVISFATSANLERSAS